MGSNIKNLQRTKLFVFYKSVSHFLFLLLHFLLLFLFLFLFISSSSPFLLLLLLLRLPLQPLLVVSSQSRLNQPTEILLREEIPSKLFGHSHEYVH